MIDYQNIARKLKSFVLDENREPSLKSYVQSIGETLSNIKLSSQSDRRRVEIAQKHVKEVKKHVRKLEERVLFLEEQVNVLEEENIKRRKLNESAFTLLSINGDTPTDIAKRMKKDFQDLTTSSLELYKESVGSYLLESKVLASEWDEWEEIVWLELNNERG